jgi:MFS family permease
MQLTILGWMVLQDTGSPWLVALVGFFGMAPVVFWGPVGGVLADSADRRTILISAQALGFAAAFSMTVTLWMGMEQYWHAYLTMGVVGTAWALSLPVRRSLIPDLFGRSGVSNAVALDFVGMGVSVMVAPALAGTLIELTGFTGGYVAVTIFYFLSLAFLARSRLPPARRGYAGVKSMGSNLKQGLQYVGSHPALRATLMVTVLMNLFLFPYMHIVPVIARDVLHVGAGLMGLLQATAGLGSLVGALVIASAVNIRYHGRLYVGGSLVAMLALMLFSFSPWYLLSVPALLLLGVGAAGFTTMQSTLVMLLSNKEMRGTALGTVSLAIGAMPLGSMIVGAVATAQSPSLALALNASAGILGLVLIGVFMPTLRRRTAPSGDGW